MCTDHGNLQNMPEGVYVIYFVTGILSTYGTGCLEEEEPQDPMDLDSIARLCGVSNLMQNSNSMQSVANMSTAMISHGR